MRSILLLFFISILTTTFSQSKEFAWLIGSWKMPNKNTFEVWRASTTGKHLEGRSFRITGADTLVTEEIKIVLQDNAFHYVPDVAGDQKAVYFKITQQNDDGFVAENVAHDFPKIIRYKLVQKEKESWLEATIEGNGKTISYSFQKQ